ncbi:MAG: MBL fold metallo-hydrolase [Candidatus Vogelbacteria bacterium]|nr:MBL fold metallo-hydrolase [Candidatus Vogelbacteria bacterium]
MKITKFGHSCLLVEEKGVRALIDPSNDYATVPDNLKDISVIIVTHEHSDHYSLELMAQLLRQNQDAQVVTNSAVGVKLSEASIDFHLVENGQSIKISGLMIEGEGELHAELHHEWPRCANTGYRIGGRLFHPGDSLEVPKLPVEILALPMAGPWMYTGMGIEFARAVKPKNAFPIHDGMLKKLGSTNVMPEKLLPKSGIEVKILDLHKEYEF